MTKKNDKDYLAVFSMILLCITSVCGICSLNFSKAYEVVNQYGQNVKIYGYGVYAHDSYLLAPISVGTDICILFVVVPMFLYLYLQYRKNQSKITELKLISIYGVSFYYAASIAFGNTYNRLFLVYVLLFSCTLFGMFRHLARIQFDQTILLTKGIRVFLILCGIALIVAWLPDVIPTLVHGGTLSTIDVYTTAITYVIDMGIISPVCFTALYLIGRKKPLGTVLYAIMLRLCMIVGIMMISQTACQIASGIDLPLPVMLTKSFSFVLLGIVAAALNHQMYKELQK